MSSVQAEMTLTGLVDLAAERLGGKAILASDEFFAEKENLLKPGRGIFLPDKYTENGKWMDGWETRRKRTPGNDWCIIQLGAPGRIRAVDIDTNHFLGNHPPYASIDACCIERDLNTPFETFEAVGWQEVLARSPLKLGSQNIFPVSDMRTWTHLRLNIYPDGGVARFRVYGDVQPPWQNLQPDTSIDLASILWGGRATACSDMFFSPMQNLIMPGTSTHMGDGWETRRRRGPGFDWVVLQLGISGTIQTVQLETTHFKGNYPDSCSIECCSLPGAPIDALSVYDVSWKPLLSQTKLQPHQTHVFQAELAAIAEPITHLKLNIFPDGGVARLRALGTPDSNTLSALQRTSAYAHA